jgi:hypothetical protein
MILDALLWLPIKVLQRAFAPVTAMLESLEEAADQIADMTNEEIDKHLGLQ